MSTQTNTDPIFNIETLGRGINSSDFNSHIALFPEALAYNIGNSRYTPERVNLDDLPHNYNRSFNTKEEMLTIVKRLRYKYGLDWVYAYTRKYTKCVSHIGGHWHIAFKNNEENINRMLKHPVIRQCLLGQWA